MPTLVRSLLLSLALTSLLPAQDIPGDWAGLLDFGSVKLHIVFHISAKDNTLTATADSPDQGAKGMPASITRDGDSVKIELTQAHAVFTGKIAADAKSFTGNFNQGAASVPLVLTPLKDAASLEPKRPQNPVKPYPYKEEDVEYENKAQHVHLAGTLTIPAGKGPFPGVVLITGSGLQDRDETILGHKPFLVIADYLTRKGIAVLRVDDRATGKSTGDVINATTADFATDVEASLAYLKSRAEVNPRKLGLIGHSEGGIIAPMVAARNKDVAFIVMLAGSGVRGEEVVVAQVAAAVRAAGRPEVEVKQSEAQEREILQLAESDQPESALTNKLREITEGQLTDAQLAAQVRPLRSPWYLYFLRYDPAPALSKLTIPVLALNGSKDTQVPPGQNLPAIRKALEFAGNKHFVVEELPGLNHLFQTANTGLLSEYAQIEETFSPIALSKIASWILQQ